MVLFFGDDWAEIMMWRSRTSTDGSCGGAGYRRASPGSAGSGSWSAGSSPTTCPADSAGRQGRRVGRVSAQGCAGDQNAELAAVKAEIARSPERSETMERAVPGSLLQGCSADSQACGQIPATGDAYFAEDFFEVVLHSVWGQVQCGCDGLGARALEDQQGDVLFAGGQIVGGQGETAQGGSWGGVDGDDGVAVTGGAGQGSRAQAQPTTSRRMCKRLGRLTAGAGRRDQGKDTGWQ